MAEAEQVIDDYRLVNLLAKGNSSLVWEVQDGGGNSYAMKLLLPDATKDAAQVAVLKHEAKLSELFQHPNFVRYHKFVKTKQNCYLLMELFRSPNLKSVLAADNLSLHLSFSRLVEQLCQALGYMHGKGWLHHDLKPDNVLIARSGELKLIDFSLSMKIKSGLGLMVGGKVKTIQGTRTYIAPETVKKQYPSKQSDIYSFGVTLFEVLTGVAPFTANSPNELLKKHLSVKPPNPSDINPNITPEADRIIGRMLAKKPTARPKDVDEVMSEFRNLKVFVKDPAEIAAEKEKTEQTGDSLDANARINSRADAARTASGEPAPARPPQPKAKPPAKKATPAPSPAPVAAQSMGQPPGWNYPPPGYPPQGFPPQGFPGQMPPQGFPGPMPPGYPYAPPLGMPGYGPPPEGGGGQPMYPGYGGWPGYPGQPNSPGPGGNVPLGYPGYPPGYDNPGQPPQPPASAQPVPPPPVAPTKPPAAAPQAVPVIPGQGRPTGGQHPSQADDSNDLPLMTELPDIL